MTEPTTPPSLRREGLWLWALAALVLLAIVTALGVRACDDEKETDKAGTSIVTEPVSTVPATTAPSITESVPETTPGGPEPDPPTLPPPGRRGETLVVGTQDLYPALEGSLTKFANQQATGKGLSVVSVVSDETFWAGRSKVQRLLVVIDLNGQAPPKVRAGQTVDFSGQVLANDGNYGVTEPDGTTLLARQGHHLLVSAQDLELR